MLHFHNTGSQLTLSSVISYIFWCEIWFLLELPISINSSSSQYHVYQITIQSISGTYLASGIWRNTSNDLKQRRSILLINIDFIIFSQKLLGFTLKVCNILTGTVYQTTAISLHENHEKLFNEASVKIKAPTRTHCNGPITVYSVIAWTNYSVIAFFNYIFKSQQSGQNMEHLSDKIFKLRCTNQTFDFLNKNDNNESDALHCVISQ